MDPLSIEGWMDPDELEWLSKYAAVSDSILEIGIWKGRSTYSICRSAKGHVTAIDNWRGAPGQENDYPNPERAEQSARLTLKEFTDFGKLRIIKGYSAEVLMSLQGTFDFIFIDGAHDYATVKLDIMLCKRRLRKGGLISGHDFKDPWVGVKKAVEEEFPRSWFRGPGSIWFWRNLTNEQRIY